MSKRLSTLKESLVSPPKSRLQLARQSTSLNGQELKDLLFGEGNFNNHVQPTLDYISQNRHIFTQHNIEGHSLEQQREEGARMVMALRKFWKVDLINNPLQFGMISYAMGMYNGAISTKSLLHYLLYAKSLALYQSNPTHIDLYNRAIKGQDIGCFSLTQFHHGSYSKGIQTLATYQPSTDEFIITTQGTKGMKFWIGALAQIANTTIIWAQLVINGQSQGPHPFFMPLRCPKTHRVLPGITIGDCGPKKGLNYIDNGYMIIDNVKIPRQYLLGKYGSVNEKGHYSSPISNWELRFGMHMSALSAGRAVVAFTTQTTSLNAATIALRYAHSRKQFYKPDKQDEVIIMDYPLTQIRIIPEIARSIVQIAAGAQLSKIYCDKSLFSDDNYVSEMHAISAAVKAKYTWTTLKTAEESRTILGGHGYSSLSRIPSIIDDIEINVTWQGDNNVLLQQASKYVLKVISKKIKTRVLDLSFIEDKSQANLEEMSDSLRNISNIDILMKDLLRTRYHLASQKLNQLKSRYQDKQTIDMHFHPEAGNALSLAYADYFTFSVVKSKVAQAKTKQVRQYFTECIYLWAFALLQKERYGTHDFRSAIQKEIMTLSYQLVGRSVVATDFLAVSSQLMGSPFADPQGNGFKEYLNILYTREGAFTRAKHYQRIKQVIKS